MRGYAVSRRYINAFNCDMFRVVNMYLDHLKLRVVWVEGMYVVVNVMLSIMSAKSPHTHHIVTPGFVDRPRRSDCTAGQMDGEAGWWTTCGNIGLPPTSKGHGSG